MSDRTDDMALFVAAVDQGSLTGAARELGLSLSSVSRHIAALEHRVGVRLLLRSTRQIAMTDAGAAYYAAAKRLLAEVDEVERSLSAVASQPIGRVSITGPTLFGRVHLMPLLAEFLVEYPQITLDVSLLDRPVNLMDEGVDISVVVGELPDSSLVARRLGSIHWVMGASPDYLNRAGRPLTPTDLSGHDCLMYSQERFADQWTLQQAGQRVQVRVQVRMRSNTLDGVVTAAVKGAGIVLAPAWALSQYVEQGELELVLRDYELPPRPVSAVLTHNRLLASKVRTLVDFLATRLGRVSFDCPT